MATKSAIYDRLQRLIAWCRPTRNRVVAVLLLAGAGVGMTVFGYDETPYPLNVLKTAFNDAGLGGVASGNAVNSMTLADVNNGKTVTYVISYGPTGNTTPDSLGALNFEDSMSASMTMVGQPQVPTAWGAPTGSGAAASYTNPKLVPGVSSSLENAKSTVFNTGSGGGDGYVPIIYTDAKGYKRFFEIYHHSSYIDRDNKINCQDFNTGVSCPGYPKEIRSNADPANSEPLGTTYSVYTARVGSRLYYPAITQNDKRTDQKTGIGCWDMASDSNCAYIQLSNKRPDSLVYDAAHSFDGFSQSIGGIAQDPAAPQRLYMAQWGQLYCYDVALGLACNGQASMQFLDSTKFAYITPLGQKGVYAVAHAATLFARDANTNKSQIYALTNGWLACLDISSWPATFCKTQAPAVWPVQAFTGTAYQYTFLWPYLNTTGGVIGVCAFGAEFKTSMGLSCYQANGNTLPIPSLLTSKPITELGYIGSSTVVGTKEYFSVEYQNATLCWDFSTSSACANFYGDTYPIQTGIRYWSTPNQGAHDNAVGATADYGYTLDPASGCLYGLGDQKLLWSFNPNTGNSPCVVSINEFVVPDPKPFCDGLDHGALWDRLEYVNTPAAVKSIDVKVFDAATCTAADTSSCAVLSTASSTVPNAVLWKVPLNIKIPLKQYPSLRVKYTFDFGADAPPTSYTGFNVTTLYTADNKGGATNGAIGQVCLRAKVNMCPASTIDNLAIIKRASNGNVLGRGLWTITTPVDNPRYSDTKPATDNLVSAGGRHLYQTSYQVTDWSGDLTAYGVDSTTGSPNADKFWTLSDGVTRTGAAGLLPKAALRNIITTLTTGAVGTGGATGVSFDFASMVAAGMPANRMAVFGGVTDDQQKLINYLRGDRSLEAKSGTNNPYRRRMLWDTTGTVTALGDFINSAPLFANGMVIAQANDGMVHAFNATNGVELFGFIPSTVTPLLPATSQVGYRHASIMDGQLAVASVNGKTILVGSAGGSTPVLYGLDITALPAKAMTKDEVRFEVTHAALGKANGAIAITKLQNGATVALLGNGLGSASNQAQLIQVDLATGAVTAYNTNEGDATLPNGLSVPTPLFAGGKLLAVYAGDVQGNLWRFPATATGLGNPVKLFKAAANQPMTSAPVLSAAVSQNGQTGYFVYAGTGRPVDRTDFSWDPTRAEEIAAQAQYAIFDTYDAGTSTFGVGGKRVQDLVKQTIDDSTNLVSANVVDLSVNAGWYIDLQVGNAALIGAERVLNPGTYNQIWNSYYFLTVAPQKGPCSNASAAYSRVVLVDAKSGQVTKDSYSGSPVNRIKITGSFGALLSVNNGSQTNNYTSNAGGSSSTSAGTKDEADNGAIHKFDTKGAGILKRTSWIQLY